MNEIDPNPKVIEARYRILLILWFAMGTSVLLFLVVLRLSAVAAVNNPRLSLALSSFGIAPVAISFLFKQRILDRSVEKQRLDLVQSAYVLAFALSEISALLGLMDHFLTGSGYYYLGFGFAGLGLLLHFPQKKHLLAAAYKEF